METEPLSEERIAFYKKFIKVEFFFFLLSVALILVRFSRIFFPFGAMLFIICMGSLATFTFLFAFSKKVVYDVKKEALLILTSLACSILSLGVLFSLMSWPGGSLYDQVGLLFSFVSLGWIAVTSGKQVFALSHFRNQMLLAKLLFLSFIAAWYVLTPPIERYKQINYHGNDPEAVRLYGEQVNDPNNKAKREAYKKYISTHRF